MNKLTKDEECALFRRVAMNERGAEAEAMRLYDNGVFWVIRQFFSSYYSVEIDDAVQTGRIGLLTAIRRFDLDRGVRFMTYAQYWIYSFVFRFIHREIGAGISAPHYKHADNQEYNEARERAAWGKVSMDRPLRMAKTGVDDGDCNLHDVLHDGPPLELFSIEKRKVNKIINGLPLQQRIVFIERMKGRSLREIGQEVGITKERVRQLVVASCARIARHFGSDVKELRKVVGYGARQL